MSGNDESRAGKPIVDVGTEPRTLALVIGVFVLVIGLPALLFVLAGRTDVAIGLVGVFVAMVVVTGHAFLKAVEAERVLRGEDDGDEASSDG